MQSKVKCEINKEDLYLITNYSKHSPKILKKCIPVSGDFDKKHKNKILTTKTIQNDSENQSQLVEISHKLQKNTISIVFR